MNVNDPRREGFKLVSSHHAYDIPLLETLVEDTEATIHGSRRAVILDAEIVAGDRDVGECCANVHTDSKRLSRTSAEASTSKPNLA